MYMRAVQILIDEDLLREIDQQAKRSKTDRSKLLRLAAARYLQELKRRSLEFQHRAGYEGQPSEREEVDAWQDVQAWPET
jgi:metal-responsive CopG/Arc/MetJ family transcriptional regulator